MKVAIYCRLSEEDRNKLHETDDSNSIQNQKAMLIQYSITQQWDIYKIYSDDDYAGADRNRPAFKRLLEDAQARKFDIVLCKTQSRFTRELELVEKYIHGLFPIWGIRFISIVDHADTANRGNKKSRQINGLVNEWYLEDMSDNIRSVLTSRRESGFHIGAFAPYGYKKDPNQKGHLIIDEEAAAIVREIFAMFVQGYGKTAIARTLNDRGIPNPTEYKRIHGFRYKEAASQANTIWKYASVAEILTNEVYIGNLVQGRYGSVSYKTKALKARPKQEWIIVAGTHEPIIEKNIWEITQNRIAIRAKPFSSGKLHPFSKKVVCIYCGYAMRIHKNRGKHYLQCATRQISGSSCPGAFVPVAELEQIVMRELKKLSDRLLDGNALEHGIELAADLSEKKQRTISNQKIYGQRRDEYANVLKQLYMDKVKGILTEADYADLSEGFRAEKKRYEEMIASCEATKAELARRMELGDNRQEIIAQYMGIENLSREMSEALIDHIAVGRRDKKSGQVPIEIFWQF